MKLYKVNLRNYGKYNMSYVVANNTDEAYKIVREYLDKKDLCFRSERELESVELIAEEGDYIDCEVQLFIGHRETE